MEWKVRNKPRRYLKMGFSKAKTAKEAIKRSSDQKLHDKILAVRNGRQAKSRNRRIPSWCSEGALGLIHDLILNLAFSAEKGELSVSAKYLFERLTRAEILCALLQETKFWFNLNKKQYGTRDLKRGKCQCKQCSPDDPLLTLIYRVTLEQLTQKYGAENWVSNHRYGETKIYPSDVKYGEFLRSHNLGHLPGGNITEDDLPPINWPALSGSDPFARREVFLRLVQGT